MNRLLLVAAFSLQAFAGEMQCPAAIAVDQKLKKPVDGWSASMDSAPLQLSMVTIYEGKPEEQASLVYDQKRMGVKDWTATWRLTPGTEYWLRCSYAGTNVQLSRRVIAKAASCVVVYEKGISVAGMPAIKSIDCK